MRVDRPVGGGTAGKSGPDRLPSLQKTASASRPAGVSGPAASAAVSAARRRRSSGSCSQEITACKAAFSFALGLRPIRLPDAQAAPPDGVAPGQKLGDEADAVAVEPLAVQSAEELQGRRIALEQARARSLSLHWLAMSIADNRVLMFAMLLR